MLLAGAVACSAEPALPSRGVAATPCPVVTCLPTLESSLLGPPTPMDLSLAGVHFLVTQSLIQRGCFAEIWGGLSGDSIILDTFLARIAGRGE